MRIVIDEVFDDFGGIVPSVRVESDLGDAPEDVVKAYLDIKKAITKKEKGQTN